MISKIPQGTTKANEDLSLDALMSRYAVAPTDRRQKALAAAFQALEGGPRVCDEPLLTLKELAQVLGYKSYTSLHRLEIQRVGEAFAGGRRKYRRSKAEAYLRSAECMRIREQLRSKRRSQRATGANDE